MTSHGGIHPLRGLDWIKYLWCFVGFARKLPGLRFYSFSAMNAERDVDLSSNCKKVTKETLHYPVVKMPEILRKSKNARKHAMGPSGEVQNAPPDSLIALNTVIQKHCHKHVEKCSLIHINVPFSKSLVSPETIKHNYNEIEKWFHSIHPCLK